MVKLTPSDASPSDRFGFSVAFSGNLIIVGAHTDDDQGANSGSAYVFELINGVWTQSMKLAAADGAAQDNFGASVAIDGDTAIVGSYRDDDNGYDSGSAYLFEHGEEGWMQAAKLLAQDGAALDRFGSNVSLSGQTAVVSAYRADAVGDDSGAVYVFSSDSESWSQQAKLIPVDSAPGDWFGRSIAIDTGRIVVGASRDDDLGANSGSAYVFKQMSGQWVESAKLISTAGLAGDSFGSSVAISGEVATVGAPLADPVGNISGSATVFRLVGDEWLEQTSLHASGAGEGQRMGYRVAMSDSTIASSMYETSSTGSVHLFTSEPDSDGDGIADSVDTDDDNDGQSDESELACGSDPLDALSQSLDIDGDGLLDCEDTDIDGDGVNNEDDAFPTDASETSDLDSDGTGDNSDTDIDGDGVNNEDDIDADNDGQSNVDEIACGSDPLSASALSEDLNANGIADCIEGDSASVPLDLKISSGAVAFSLTDASEESLSLSSPNPSSLQWRYEHAGIAWGGTVMDVTGNVVVNAKKGIDNITLNGIALPSELHIVKSNTGSIRLQAQDVSVEQYLRITGSPGEDSVVLKNISSDRVSIVTNSGNDALELRGVTAGRLSANSGKGDDTLIIGAGASSNSHVDGAVTVRMVSGNNNVVVDQLVSGAFVGSSGSGDDNWALGNSQFNSRLTIVSSYGNDMLSLTDSSVQGRTTLNSGTGDDSIASLNNEFTVKAYLTCGAGTDSVTTSGNSGPINQTNCE